jgi:hypothetical protein
MTYEIQSGIPIPAGRNNNKYPFRAMRIGDSFFAAGIKQSGISSVLYAFSKRNPEFRFTVRKEGDGVRVWRIAPKYVAKVPTWRDCDRESIQPPHPISTRA